MDGDPFLVDARINKHLFLTSLVDSECLSYSTISKRQVRRFKLLRIFIFSREMEGFGGVDMTVTINAVTYLYLDINGFQ